MNFVRFQLWKPNLTGPGSFRHAFSSIRLTGASTSRRSAGIPSQRSPSTGITPRQSCLAGPAVRRSGLSIAARGALSKFHPVRMTPTQFTMCEAAGIATWSKSPTARRTARPVAAAPEASDSTAPRLRRRENPFRLLVLDPGIPRTQYLTSRSASLRAYGAKGSPRRLLLRHYYGDSLPNPLSGLDPCRPDVRVPPVRRYSWASGISELSKLSP